MLQVVQLTSSYCLKKAIAINESMQNKLAIHLQYTSLGCSVEANEKFTAPVDLLKKMLRFESDRIPLDGVMQEPFFTSSLPPGTDMMGQRARESEEAFQEQNALELQQFETRVQASMQPEPGVNA